MEQKLNSTCDARTSIIKHKRPGASAWAAGSLFTGRGWTRNLFLQIERHADDTLKHVKCCVMSMMFYQTFHLPAYLMQPGFANHGPLLGGQVGCQDGHHRLERHDAWLNTCSGEASYWMARRCQECMVCFPKTSYVFGPVFQTHLSSEMSHECTN